VADALNGAGRAVRGAHVLVLGVAYKRDIDDIRESPALDIIRLLEQQGAAVTYHDPHVSGFREDGKEYRSVPLTRAALESADCVMIVTDHSAIDFHLVKRHARLAVDTRHALPRGD
jgi:UDP-N-acetyl-D-glucosamine dehydrogenase